ncbi:hypothetical protein P153DRAFT_434790 [Dothidotthia symphoricarpi CBS 119687]|uniref:Uncharacterized protein n=1 Tax=Dothidotthia symphoricarpi CBS 119687 TaxID=1392245 RepID=A0A6A6A1S1_9PLEO|nr:uncharacterized protein P153DRAFT_434790 [Dothidotthia symphoricarpi CBS 119687]KAF2125114.1 hypothetical protein P153DRAFT_434790 [Dothidotthia symphoricarpi CBS 119687]
MVTQIEKPSLAITADACKIILTQPNFGSPLEVDMSEPCVTVAYDVGREKEKEAEYATCFENVVKAELDIPNGYAKVVVLIIRWDDEIDDFKEGHDKEIRRLRRVLQDDFRFEVSPEVRLGTTKNPQNTLNSAIASHMDKHDGQNNLLVVYYTGHGLLRGPVNGNGRLELSATSNAHRATNGQYSATAYWDLAERPLLDPSTEADVLVLLDCCFAGNSHKSTTDDRRTYELLAACPRDGTTRAPGPDSFTTRLLDSLEGLLANGKGLHFLTTKLKNEINKPGEISSELYDRLDNHNGRHVQLAPLGERTAAEDKTLLSRPREQAGIKLRFSLRESELSKNQIEKFAQELVKACKEANMPIRQIDWIKMKQQRPREVFRRVEKDVTRHTRRTSSLLLPEQHVREQRSTGSSTRCESVHEESVQRGDAERDESKQYSVVHVLRVSRPVCPARVWMNPWILVVLCVGFCVGMYVSR